MHGRKDDYGRRKDKRKILGQKQLRKQHRQLRQEAWTRQHRRHGWQDKKIFKI
jgi:hypothetical protein